MGSQIWIYTASSDQGYAYSYTYIHYFIHRQSIPKRRNACCFCFRPPLEKFGQFGELRCLLYPVFEGCLPIVNCTGIDERMVDTCRPSTAMGIPGILPWRSPSQNRIFLTPPKRNHGLGNFLIIGTIEMGCLIYFNFRVMGFINGLWVCLCSLNFQTDQDAFVSIFPEGHDTHKYVTNYTVDYSLHIQ